MFIRHPLAMGLTLIIQTSLIAIFTGAIIPNFWFSYILFLVFLGGILVLFIYVCSLASNEKFSMSSAYLLIMALPPISYCLTYLYKNLTPLFPNLNLSSGCLVGPSPQTDPRTFIIKLYGSLTAPVTAILVCYLLFTLIVVVKITEIRGGPLRPYTN